MSKRNPTSSNVALLSDSKRGTLTAASDFLSPALARRNGIRSSFKEYTSNLTYDLSVYRDFFDQLDSRCQGEPESVRTSMQQEVIENEGRYFKEFLDKGLDELNKVVTGFSREEHQQHGSYFRKQVWSFILCCPHIAHTNLKPRGYAGDYEVMQMIYENNYRGDSIFSKLMHKHAVEQGAAESVRNRIRLIKQMLLSFRENSDKDEQKELRVLSVGSGPGFEIQDILKTPLECTIYRFVLLDQDPLALAEAARLVKTVGDKTGVAPLVDYVNASVRNMIFSRRLHQKWGYFDYIYSMGLFDYLSAPVARALLKRLYGLLAPGGEMMVGNFHVSNPSRYYMEYWCDWLLCHRTEEEFRDLVDLGQHSSISILFESTGSQMFLRVKKGDDFSN